MLKISRTASRTALAITALVATIAVSSIAAHADELTVSGTASGGFNGGSGTTLGGLEYFGSTFNGTSAGGFIGFGGAIGVANNNFGMFRLDDDPFNYIGNTFTLNLTFATPGGISGGNVGTYNAAVQGVVAAGPTGGVNLDFDNNPILFTFLDGQTQGSFRLAVNDVALYPKLDNTVSGVVTEANQTVIPEPGTLALIGASLLPLAGAVARRRRAA